MDLANLLMPIVSRVRTDVTAIKNADGSSRWTDEALTSSRLVEHLTGGSPRGVCPIKEGESITRLALLDLDSHRGETSWSDMQITALSLKSKLEENGFKPNIFRSSGGHGIHMYFIWNESQDAYSVRQHLKSVLDELGYANGTKGVAKKQIEIFPKQDQVRFGGKGNQFILPLAGKSVPLDLNLMPIPRDSLQNINWQICESVKTIDRPSPCERKAPTATEDEELTELREILSYIDPDTDRDKWIRILAGLHYETGGSVDGLLLADEWSSGALYLDRKYGVSNYVDLDDVEKNWGSFNDKPTKAVTGATIKMYAREAGWDQRSLKNIFDIPYENSLSQTGRFQIIEADDYANGPEPKWIIDEVIPASGIVMLIGASGSAKTFFILDLIASIALGKKWRGKDVKQGRVIYVAAEGASGIAKRLKAYKIHNEVTTFGKNLGIIADTPNFLRQEDIALADSISRSGGASVIVIDTLAQTTPGADENGSSDMGKALSSYKALQKATGALIILVHHIGKNTAKGARGWSGMKGAMDAELEVTRDGEIRHARISKQKDGEDGAIFPFELISVRVSDESNSKAIYSCVVKHLDDEKITKSKPKSKWQAAIYAAVLKLTATGNITHTVDCVISEAINHIPYDAGSDAAKPFRDRRRDQARRALTEMSGSLLYIEGNLVSLPQPV